MKGLKEQWLKLSQRIDALTLRERLMAFAIAALLLITLINTIVLDPLLSRQKQLSDQIKQEQQQIAAMQAEIQARVNVGSIDPDAATRERLRSMQQRSANIRQELLGMQKGLVSPDKMASLLEDLLLKQNGRLRLVSLKTLPVTLLEEPLDFRGKPGPDKAGPSQGAKPEARSPSAEAIYKHGVEIVVQGGYLDIANYLTQLESMPWQLFWANARLSAETYPGATLKLTLFTLSLDKRWLNV